MNMETNNESFKTEMEMATRFIEYLTKKRGYPQDSIATEYKIGNKWSADIAILEPKTGIPIQLFELKRYAQDSNVVEHGINQLKRYRSGLKNKNIPLYLVFSKNTEPFFNIRNIENIGEEAILNYNGSRVAGLSEEKKIIKQEQKDDIKKYFRTYLFFGVLLLVFIGLSKILPFKIETNDVIIIGIVAVLLLVYTIPYIKIKLESLGIEFGKSNEKSSL